MSVSEVLDAVRALSPAEQAQVRVLLDTLQSAPEPQMTEDEWKPIEVQGTPLSRMIIEERH